MISYTEVVSLLRIHIEEGFKLTQNEIDQILDFLENDNSFDDFVIRNRNCYRWIDLPSKDVDLSRLSSKNQSWSHSLDGIHQFVKNQDIFTNLKGSLFIGDVYGIDICAISESWGLTVNKYINEDEILSL